MNDLSINIKLINDLKVKKTHTRFEGEFDKICWTDINKISTLLQLGLEELFPSAIVFAPNYQDEIESGKIANGVDLIISNCEIESQTLEQIVLYVLQSIIKENNNQDLFYEKDMPDQLIVNKLQPIILRFVEKNNGKKISQPIQLKVGKDRYILTGNFRKIVKDVKYLDKVMILGILDTLIVRKSKCEIIEDKKTIIVAYFDYENFFYDLRNFLGSKVKLNFELQPVINKNDKVDYLLRNLIPFKTPDTDFM